MKESSLPVKIDLPVRGVVVRSKLLLCRWKLRRVTRKMVKYRGEKIESEQKSQGRPSAQYQRYNFSVPSYQQGNQSVRSDNQSDQRSTAVNSQSQESRQAWGSLFQSRAHFVEMHLV